MLSVGAASVEKQRKVKGNTTISLRREQRVGCWRAGGLDVDVWGVTGDVLASWRVMEKHNNQPHSVSGDGDGQQ